MSKLNPPPIMNQLLKLDHNTHHKTPFSFRTLKELNILHVHQKSFRCKKAMKPIKSRMVNRNDSFEHVSHGVVSAFEPDSSSLVDNGGSFHQTVDALRLHTFLNRLSKWLAVLPFSASILLRHDAFSFWAAMGTLFNFILSITMKRILKQERPVSRPSSGHGMPSSHAQSIFFALVFVIFLAVKWQGLNGFSAIIAILLVALGCYFSWLRILLRYHTTGQVVVGALIGSIFSVSYFWAWEAIVHKAYYSILWVRIVVGVGAVCFCVGFILDVIKCLMTSKIHDNCYD